MHYCASENQECVVLRLIGLVIEKFTAPKWATMNRVVKNSKRKSQSHRYVSLNYFPQIKDENTSSKSAFSLSNYKQAQNSS